MIGEEVETAEEVGNGVVNDPSQIMSLIAGVLVMSSHVDMNALDSREYYSDWPTET